MSIIADFTANGEEILRRSSAVAPECVHEKSLPEGRLSGCRSDTFFRILSQRLFGQCVDLAGQAGLLAGRAVLVIHVVRSCLIDRLASERKEGFRFISVSSLNGIEDAAGSRADTGLLSSILCVALCVGFHTKDRSFDVRQVIHPLIFRTILEYDSMPPGKKQPLFLIARDFRRRGAGSAAGDARPRLSCHGRGRDDIMEKIFPGRRGGTAAALRTRKTAGCIPRGAAGF